LLSLIFIFDYHDYSLEVVSMVKGSMNKNDAARIQSHADKSGSNQGFKARAQSAASKYAKK
jgi:hypothetical protein